jgi:hypothetical protein
VEIGENGGGLRTRSVSFSCTRMDMQCRPGQTLKSQQGSAHQKAPCQDVLVHKGEQWRGGGGFGFTGPRVETTRVGLQKKDMRAISQKGGRRLNPSLVPSSAKSGLTAGGVLLRWRRGRRN